MERMHATQVANKSHRVEKKRKTITCLHSQEVDRPFHEEPRLPGNLDLGLDSEDALSTTSTSSTESSSSSSSGSSSSDEEDDTNAPKRKRASHDDVDDLLSGVYTQPNLESPPSMIGCIDEEMFGLETVECPPQKSNLEAKEELAWPERPATPIPWNTAAGNSSSMCPQKSCDIWCCHMWATGRSSGPAESPTNLTTSVAASTSAFSHCHPTQLAQVWPSSNHQSYSLSAVTTSTSATTMATSEATPSSSTVYLQDQKSEKHFTCGQSSLFGELQSVVFNSLLASLET
jgi:hypothetical protein